MVFRVGRAGPAAAFFVLTTAGALPCAGIRAAGAQTAPVSTQTQASPTADTPMSLDPNSPLAPLPDIGVAWPDLATSPMDPAATVAAVDANAESRYAWRIDGIDGINDTLLRQRFAQLSTLDANDHQAANAAQLDRRAREDADLLNSLLRAEGYYDANVITRVEPGAKPMVVLSATPGTLYKFKGVTIDGIAAAGDKAPGLTTAFGIKPKTRSIPMRSLRGRPS